MLWGEGSLPEVGQELVGIDARTTAKSLAKSVLPLGVIAAGIAYIAGYVYGGATSEHAEFADFANAFSDADASLGEGADWGAGGAGGGVSGTPEQRAAAFANAVSGGDANKASEIQGSIMNPSNEDLYNEYTGLALKQAIRTLPIGERQQELGLEMLEKSWADMNSPEAQQMRQAEAEQASLLIMRIQEAKDLGEITGDLTPQEIEQFRVMEENAYNQMQSATEDTANKVFSSTISDMVNRGVLQGDVGRQAMNDVGKNVTEYVARSGGDISSQMAGQKLSFMENKKKDRMGWEEALMGMEVSDPYYKDQANLTSAITAGTASSKTNLAFPASRYSTDVQASTSKYGYDTQANQALQQSIMSNQQQSSSDKWGFWGDVAGIAGSWLLK